MQAGLGGAMNPGQRLEAALPGRSGQHSLLNPPTASTLELALETKIRKHFTITEQAPTRAFSWLEAFYIQETIKAAKHGK